MRFKRKSNTGELEIMLSLFCKVIFTMILVLSNVVIANGQAPVSEVGEPQEKSESSKNYHTTINKLYKGIGIWSGTAFFNRNKMYYPQIGSSGERNMEQDITMNFGANLEYIRILNPNWGIGIKGFFETVFNDNFKSANVAYLGAGPALRGYFLDKGKFQGYGQINLLLGYDMGRSSPLANQGSEFTYRTELRLGTSYRLSDSFGVFLHAGPDWEGEKNTFGYQRFQFEMGIQLFRF